MSFVYRVPDIIDEIEIFMFAVYGRLRRAGFWTKKESLSCCCYVIISHDHFCRLVFFMRNFLPLQMKNIFSSTRSFKILRNFRFSKVLLHLLRATLNAFNNSVVCFHVIPLPRLDSTRKSILFEESQQRDEERVTWRMLHNTLCEKASALLTKWKHPRFTLHACIASHCSRDEIA